MLDDERNSDSQQEQNYDHIFDTAEKNDNSLKDRLLNNKKLYYIKDGEYEMTTLMKLIVIVGPLFILFFLTAILLFVMDVGIRATFVLAAVVMIAIAIWRTFFGSIKYHPQPLICYMLTWGILLVLTNIVYEIQKMNPSVDTLRFFGFSALCFSVIFIVYGTILLCRHRMHDKACRTQIMARCTKFQKMLAQAGKPHMILTWEYEFGDVAYKVTSYHDEVRSTQEGTEAPIRIDPEHPQRLCCEEKPVIKTWAAKYVRFGVLLACIGVIALYLPQITAWLIDFGLHLLGRLLSFLE
ncbi:MAG: hypothetical protein IKK51_09405 [Oscillospiraceae bacterium]|nr:hypothetical protein [Oscillospiraceae bacterium]